MIKKYTLEEYNNFEIDKNGVRHCPQGDYSLIEKFDVGEGAPFAFFESACIFGRGSEFGESTFFWKKLPFWCGMSLW